MNTEDSVVDLQLMVGLIAELNHALSSANSAGATLS